MKSQASRSPRIRRPVWIHSNVVGAHNRDGESECSRLLEVGENAGTGLELAN